MNTQRILIVDDDRNLCQTLSHILQVKGYVPLTARTGKAALDKIDQETPDVVLIDLRLEDMSGLHVLEEIKKRAPGTECILFTGYASQSSAIEAINLGAYGYVQKPYDVEQLLVIIRRAIEKQQAEKTLVAKERYFRSLLHTLHEDILVIDRNYRITDLNNTFLRTTGHKREEAIGRHCFEISHGYNEPCDRRGEACALRQVFDTGEPHNCLHEHVRTDGSTVHVDILLSPLKDEAGNVTHVVESVRDISELMRAQEALSKSEKLYRSLIDNAQDAIFIVDGETGMIQDANRAAQHMLGRSLQAIRRMHQSEIVVPQEAALEREHFGQIVNKHHLAPRRYHLLSVDGHRTPVEASSGLIELDDRKLVIGIFRDITERKKAEEERARLVAHIQEQAQQIQHTIDTVPEGVLLLDVEKQLVLANPVAKEYLVSLTGEQMNDTLTHLGDRSLAELLAPPPEGLWHQVTADNLSFEVIAQAIKAGPTSEGWVLVIRDVTQERETQQRTQQQERLAAVGQLAAGIAHDFNNIMAVIVLYTQMTLRSPDLLPQTRERLQTISQQARRATDLIQQILDFSRRAVLERRPMDLVPFLKEQVKLLERTLPEHIQIEMAHGSGEYVVSVDPTRLQQMVMNLAVNARDAMPQGGQLKIGLERLCIEDGKKAPLPELSAGEWVRLTVADTGTGIPLDVLPYVFEPFFTTKAPGKGSGLGLAQVYGIVKQHKGEIDVKSRAGHGTLVLIYLPALLTPGSDATMRETPPLSEGHGETILVVEDDAATREALVDSLTMLNYRVLTATNGQDAMNVFEQRRGKVALVLSDLVMPVMGGQELLRALRQRDSQVPLVMLTGHPVDRELTNLKAWGLSDWLLKPPSLEQLAEVVERALKKKKVCAALFPQPEKNPSAANPSLAGCETDGVQPRPAFRPPDPAPPTP